MLKLYNEVQLNKLRIGEMIPAGIDVSDDSLNESNNYNLQYYSNKGISLNVINDVNSLRFKMYNNTIMLQNNRNNIELGEGDLHLYANGNLVINTGDNINLYSNNNIDIKFTENLYINGFNDIISHTDNNVTLQNLRDAYNNYGTAFKLSTNSNDFTLISNHTDIYGGAGVCLYSYSNYINLGDNYVIDINANNNTKLSLNGDGVSKFNSNFGLELNSSKFSIKSNSASNKSISVDVSGNTKFMQDVKGDSTNTLKNFKIISGNIPINEDIINYYDIEGLPTGDNERTTDILNIRDIKAQRIFTTNGVIIDRRNYTEIIGTANDFANGTFYFASVKPNNKYEAWHIKYKIKSNINGSNNGGGSFICEMNGAYTGRIAYSFFNSHYSTSYRSLYYHVLYTLTNAGIDNGYGHLIGIGLRSSWNPTTVANARNFDIEIIEADNCTVTMFDTMIKYANVPGTGTTNYTSYAEYDGYNNGLRESGDDNNIDRKMVSGCRFTAGQYGILNTQLFMEDGEGTYQSLTTSYTINTTKVCNQTGFKIDNVYYATNAQSKGGITANSTTYISLPIDFRYTTNCGTTLVLYKPVYLVGKIIDDLFYLKTDCWYSQELPTIEDGYYYIYLGNAYSNYNIFLLENHPVYYYDNGIQEYIKHHHDDKYNIQNNVFGSYIHIEDSADARLKKLEIYGNSTQDGTPTPNTPIDIVSVGDSGSVDITVCGKNLIKEFRDFNPLIIYGLTINIDNNCNIKITGTNTSPLWTSITPSTYDTAFVLDAGTYTISGLTGLNNSQNLRINVYTIYKDNSNKFISALSTNECNNFTITEKSHIFISFWVGVANLSINIKGKLQIELGSIATDYELYKEQKITIPLDEPLRGTYDRYKNYISDIICEQDGQIGVLRSMNFIRFNDTRNIPSAFSNVGCYTLYNNYLDAVMSGAVMSNIAIMASNNNFNCTTTANSVGISGDRINLYFPDVKTLDDFKTLLPNAYCIYQLKTPIFTPFSSDIQTKYKELKSYLGVTNIINSDNANMSCDYIRNNINGNVIADISNDIKDNYLPLTGGSITGDLSVNKTISTNTINSINGTLKVNADSTINGAITMQNTVTSSATYPTITNKISTSSSGFALSVKSVDTNKNTFTNEIKTSNSKLTINAADFQVSSDKANKFVSTGDTTIDSKNFIVQNSGVKYIYSSSGNSNLTVSPTSKLQIETNGVNIDLSDSLQVNGKNIYQTIGNTTLSTNGTYSLIGGTDGTCGSSINLGILDSLNKINDITSIKSGTFMSIGKDDITLAYSAFNMDFGQNKSNMTNRFTLSNSSIMIGNLSKNINIKNDSLVLSNNSSLVNLYNGSVYIGAYDNDGFTIVTNDMFSKFMTQSEDGLTPFKDVTTSEYGREYGWEISLEGGARFSNIDIYSNGFINTPTLKTDTIDLLTTTKNEISINKSINVNGEVISSNSISTDGTINANKVNIANSVMMEYDEDEKCVKFVFS